MFRMLIGLPLLVFLIAGGTMVWNYGEVDPCRALAVERAHGAVLHGVSERWERLQTSQMTGTACARGLIGDWWDRQRKRR
jgi:hypothetical protein